MPEKTDYLAGLLVRFQRHVIPEPMTGCLLWMAKVNGDGYGVTRNSAAAVRDGWPDFLLAHRVAWELEHGPIPNGMLVCHRCDTPPCANHEHLFLGTPADNTRDRDQKGRGGRPRVETCKRGHVRTKENTYLYKGDPDHRQCRECRAITERAWRSSRVLPQR